MWTAIKEFFNDFRIDEDLRLQRRALLTPGTTYKEKIQSNHSVALKSSFIRLKFNDMISENHNQNINKNEIICRYVPIQFKPKNIQRPASLCQMRAQNKRLSIWSGPRTGKKKARLRLTCLRCDFYFSQSPK